MANEHPLAIWRKAKNLTQQGLASKLGITRWMVNSIETSRRRPSLKLALKIQSETEDAVQPSELVSEETSETEDAA